MAKDFFVERPSSGNPRARRGRCDGPKVVGFPHDERALNAPYRERGKGTCRAMKPKIGNDWDELANRSMSTRHALILTEMKSVSFCFSAGFCVSRACQSFFFFAKAHSLAVQFCAEHGLQDNLAAGPEKSLARHRELWGATDLRCHLWLLILQRALCIFFFGGEVGKSLESLEIPLSVLHLWTRLVLALVTLVA